jgi:hypothetical protein
MSGRRSRRATAYSLEGTAERVPVVIEGCGHMHPVDAQRKGACGSCGWLSGDASAAPTVARPRDYFREDDA